LEICRSNGQFSNALKQAFNLSAEDLLSYQKLADAEGDARSAFYLALYYLFTKGDEETGDAYLRKASDAGSRGAAMYLSVLEDRKEPTSSAQ
jgi:TPR repeat protein